MYDDLDDPDQLPPEELLHRSAAPLRRDHPMDGWHEVTPGAPSSWAPAEVAEPSVVAALRRSSRDRLHAWKQAAGDRWTGWWERRRQARGKGPSERAWNEALEYFAGRYRERDPEPLTLARVVRRNGTPDWSNPFPQGHARHYDYHPDGLLMMDITVLLEGMMNSLDEAETGAGDLPPVAPRSRDQVEWVTLEDAIRDNEHDARERSQRQQRLAMASWAIVLAQGNGLARSLQAVHRDNLAAITIETLLVLDPQPWGVTLPQIAAGAVTAGVINLPLAQALLRQRQLVDQQGTDGGRAQALPVPKAPPLPLDAWLARKAAGMPPVPAGGEAGDGPDPVEPTASARVPEQRPEGAVLQDFDSPHRPQ